MYQVSFENAERFLNYAVRLKFCDNADDADDADDDDDADIL